MKVHNEIAWKVWYIPSLRQWTCAPPDGYFNKDKQWTYLTNIHATYWPKRITAWERAMVNAKKMRTLALCYYKHKTGISDIRDYRPRGEQCDVSSSQISGKSLSQTGQVTPSPKLTLPEPMPKSSPGKPRTRT